ncbi:MAG: hydroxychlorobactene glucosyltransferase CruC [Candidatus Promineifilaceae bacterium]
MMALHLFLLVALAVMAATATLNCFMLPRLGRKQATISEGPRLSVLIPARNEVEQIAGTVRSLLAQEYPHLEVMVLDDQSNDGTGAAAMAAANGDVRFRLLRGSPLPDDWLGKNWACHQLAQAASGDVLLFTDADVQWLPGALTAAVAELKRSGADLLSIWPTQQTVSWGERLVTPLMALAVLAYLPLALVHHTPWAAFAAANGQCLIFRRRAYDAIGGHTAVRQNVLEDVALARLVKNAGMKLRLADGAGWVQCRMYQCWGEVQRGFGKNILAGYGGRVSLLLLAALFHWLAFVYPWLWLALGAATPLPGWPMGPLLLALLGVLVRALTAAITRQRVRDAWLMPVSVGLMSVVAAQAIWWRVHGGAQWKGRTV